MFTSKVETLCLPSHPFKSLGMMTCRIVTSLKASDTAVLHCRAEIDLSLSTYRSEATLLRAGIFTRENPTGHWEGHSGERQERPTGRHSVPPAPQANSRLTPSVGAARAAYGI